MTYVPNGGWRNHRRVEFYVKEGTKDSINVEFLITQICNFLVAGLVSTSIHIYLRHR